MSFVWATFGTAYAVRLEDNRKTDRPTRAERLVRCLVDSVGTFRQYTIVGINICLVLVECFVRRLCGWNPPQFGPDVPYVDG